MNNDLIISKLNGILLGTALGDSIGLPYENLSKKRILKYAKTPLRQSFFFGMGVASDDTEHTLLVTKSLIFSNKDLKKFTSHFAWSLRFWFLTLPPGIGLGTLRAIIKLWIGISPNKSGVDSAGNGPSMKAAIVGAYFYDNPILLEEFVSATTKITHSDKKALTGALAIAQVAAYEMKSSSKPNIETFINLITPHQSDNKWHSILNKIKEANDKNFTVSEFSQSINLERGISGYTYHTVPIALYSWYINYGDFKKAVTEVILCGGDTDTTAAITGALVGATTGVEKLPAEWVNRFKDWPFSKTHILNEGENLKNSLLGNKVKVQLPYFWFGLIPRNLIIMSLILIHLLRRLLVIR